MNRNDKAPHPVLIKRAVIAEYKESFREMLRMFYGVDTRPTVSLAISGRLMEMQYVLKTFFEIPEEELDQMDEEAQDEARREVERLKTEEESNND